MNLLLKRILWLNVIWSTAFFLLLISTKIYSKIDGKKNYPLFVDQYKEKGGNTVDYYLGYAFITTNNYVNSSVDDKMQPDIIHKTYLRILYLIMFTLLWAYGLNGLFAIQRYYQPTDEDLIMAKKIKKPILKPDTSDYVFGILSTLISLYGVYYTSVYIVKFWLE